MWREAKSLLVLLAQVNGRWANRRKDSDGEIGDEAHQHRVSDHDPDANGVVTALDITHDPANGFDSYAFADMLRAARDKRIKYIISNRRICSSSVDPWAWRPYHGINPHNHHVHISVLDDPAKYDDETPWELTAANMPPPVSVSIIVPQTLRLGDSGNAVLQLQKFLNSRNISVVVDGFFGDKTLAAVKLFQSQRGLVADGVVGPQTFKALSP